MKVRLKNGIRIMTGRADDVIYYYNRALDMVLMRKYTPPSVNPSATRMQLIMANLKLIQPSAGYKQSFRDYLPLYNALPANRDKMVPSWNNLYIKMLFTMSKTIPDIDLNTISRQQIYDQNLPCISLQAAIEAGLLPKVRDWSKFIELI